MTQAPLPFNPVHQPVLLEEADYHPFEAFSFREGNTNIGCKRCGLTLFTSIHGLSPEARRRSEERISTRATP